MTALRPRERRLLAGAAVVAIALLGYVYGIEPLLARHRQVRELIVVREELLARQRRLLEREVRYAQELATLQDELARGRARLLPGDRPPLAASELQKLVKSTAEATGIEVRSERILPPTDRGGYTEVPVEVTLSGPIRALTAFTHRLEAAPVFLTLGDVRLRVVSIAAPRELSATIAVTGYIQGTPDGAAPRRPDAGPRTPGA
jgi:Tfp pilus assembly protein PilO